MARGKGGRKRKPGERHDCGRLKAVHDYGNDRIQAMIAVFHPFQAGKAGQWVGSSAIGRAWAVGLLDGHEADAAAIRDAGLNYADLYWGCLPKNREVSNYEGEDRRGGGGSAVSIVIGGVEVPEDKRGDYFKLVDDAIRASGRRDAVHHLVIDTHWFPQDNPDWLDRLINERLLRQGRPVAGQLPIRGDVEKLNLAIEGLLVVVAGSKRRAA